MANRGCEGQIAIDAIELINMRTNLDNLISVGERILGHLDYLQNLWGKEGITDSMAKELALAIKQAKGGSSA